MKQLIKLRHICSSAEIIYRNLIKMYTKIEVSFKLYIKFLIQMFEIIIMECANFETRNKYVFV